MALIENFDPYFMNSKSLNTNRVATNINDLPSLVLCKIFSYFSLDDLRNVRLACRQWNDASNTATILQNIYIQLRCDVYGNEMIFNYLQDCWLRILNLKIYNFNLTSSFEVWRTSGLRMRNLHFFNCVFDMEILEAIIWHCPELESFVWKGELLLNYAKLSFPDLVERLVARGVRREKLKTFDCIIESKKLRYGGEEIKRFVEAMSSVFPNLPSIRVADKRAGFYSSIVYLSGYSTGICDSMVEEFEKLHHSFRDINYVEFFQQYSRLLKYIQSVTIVVDDAAYEDYYGDEADEPRREMPKYVIIQYDRKHCKEMEHIQIKVPFQQIKFSSFLSLVFAKCVNIRKLKIVTSTEFGTVHLDAISCLELIKSKLKYLEINCCRIEFDSSRPRDKSYCIPNNDTLDTLIFISQKSVNANQFGFYMLNNITNIRKLWVGRVTDTMLAVIWQTQRNLLSFGVYDKNIGQCTPSGFLNQKRNANGIRARSIVDLKKLEHLHLSISYKTQGALLAATKLPNLRYLELTISSLGRCLSEDIFMNLNLPKLEYLTIRENRSWYKYDEIIWLKFCCQFKKLKRIAVYSGGSSTPLVWVIPYEGWTRKDFENLFASCPDLAFIKSDDRVHCRKSAQIIVRIDDFDDCKGFKELLIYNLPN